MQALDIQPTNPTPYTPVSGTYNTNPVPGAGGLPALSGLNNRMNPMAAQLQAQGRGEDSMLVHMTPDEVSGLQALAMHHGTTMTVNPNTGLPEAGLLGGIFKKLIPTLLGGALAATGIGAPLAAGIVGLGSTALTGSLKKGLMAGLGAFGGASLAGAAGLGGSISNNAFGALSDKAGILGSNMGAGAIGDVGKTLMSPEFAKLAAQEGGKGLASPGFFSQFGTTAKAGLPGFAAKAAPMLAASSLLGTVSNVDQAIQQGKGSTGGPPDLNTWKYEGPYRPMERRYNPRVTTPTGEGELSFFDYSNPYPGYLTATGGLPSNFPAGATATGFAGGGDTKSAVDVSKLTHEQLTQGLVDPITGNFTQLAGNPFQAGIKPGAVSDFGGGSFVVTDEGKWKYAGPVPTGAPAATPAASAITGTTQGQLPPSTRLTLTGVPLTDTAPGPMISGGPVTDTNVRTGATSSGYGVETLKDVYTPQFTTKDNFVTPAAKPYTVGSEMAQKLPDFIDMYRTSPGAITAPLQYPGGTFNQQVRAQLAAAPRQPTAFDKFMANYYSAYGAYPTSSSDIAPSDMSYAKGGVHMDDGAFVVDARTVSELGNGSSSAGQELLARLGGRPVKGPGDGVSDSIPANIGGTQEARVARDEVIFPAAAVKKLGGAKKLYALMDKAHAARKKADRGEDTKLRKGLGAL